MIFDHRHNAAYRVDDPSSSVTRPAVTRCKDPSVTVSHTPRGGGFASQLKIISVKPASAAPCCAWTRGRKADLPRQSAT